MNFFKKGALAFTAVTLTFALSGCIKLDADTTVKSDNTISGTLISAQSKDASGMMDTVEPTTFSDEAKKYVTIEPYETDEFKGEKVTFKDMPLDLWNEDEDKEGEPNNIPIKRVGDTFVIEATDLAETATEGDDPAAAPEDEMFNDEEMKSMVRLMLKDAEISYKIAFPGKITEHVGPGTVEGNVWSMDKDDFMVLMEEENAELKVVAGAEESIAKKFTPDALANEDGDNTVMLIAGGGLLLVLLGGVLFLILRRKQA